MARPPAGDLAHNGTVDKGTCNKREGTNLWYLSKKEIEENSPSRRDGIDLKKETYLRKSYCTFMQDLGMRLKVPQVTIATAIIFCHRFFLYQSHAKNDRRTIAAVCMFLAGKVEETPRPLKDVIIVSYEIIHKRDPDAGQRIRQRDVYEQQKELILIGERVVLTTLGFDLNIHQPYRPLVEAIKKLKVAQNSLAQVAWNFVNDGLRTSLCLQFKAHHIAAGAIFLAAKFLKVKLPSEGEKVWWKEFGVTSRQLEEVSNQMLELYEQNRTPASQGSENGASAGGWASHQAPVKLAAGEGPVSVKSNSQVERIPSAKSGSLNPPFTSSGSDQKRANSKEGDVHASSQSQSNDHGSAESKSDISEHRLDDETKERRHPKQQPLPYITDKKSEASDKSRLGSKPTVDLEKENAVPANIELEEQKNGTAPYKFDNKGLGNKDHLGLSQEDSIKKIDKEKVKAALEKRKKLRGDVARKELMDDDDLIERELEDGVELAIEDEKVKRRRNQDQFNPSNSPASENQYGKGHKKIRNGSYQETEKRESGGINGDEVEDGEVAVVHDGELLQSRKRKAVESPDKDLEGKLHEDHIPGYHMTTGEKNRNARHNYIEKDHKRHAEENRL